MRHISLFVNGIFILVGVIGTLVYFHFGATQKVDGSVHRNVLINVGSLDWACVYCHYLWRSVCWGLHGCPDCAGRTHGFDP